MREPSISHLILTPPVGRLPRFSTEVVEARRDRNLTIEAVARTADLPLALVSAVEAGAEPSRDERLALCRALDLPGGKVQPPVPHSAPHARLMRACESVRMEKGGVALVSDVRAWAASLATRSADLEPVRTRLSLRPLWGSLRGHCVGLASLLAADVAIFQFPPWDWLVNLLILTMVATMFMAVRVVVLATPVVRKIRQDVEVADRKAGHDREDELRRHDERCRKVEQSMLCRGHVVSRDGVTLVVDDGRPERRTKSSDRSDVYSVRVERVSSSHVTVRVGTTDADYEMPWVRLSSEMADVLRDLVSDDDVPWTSELVMPDDLDRVTA